MALVISLVDKTKGTGRSYGGYVLPFKVTTSSFSKKGVWGTSTNLECSEWGFKVFKFINPDAVSEVSGSHFFQLCP